jgi:hypothetical protein
LLEGAFDPDERCLLMAHAVFSDALAGAGDDPQHFDAICFLGQRLLNERAPVRASWQSFHHA